MKNLTAKLVLMVSISFAGSLSWGSLVPSVSASVFRSVCGYYSNTSGKVKFQYQENDPNAGTVGLQSVSLVYGLVGHKNGNGNRTPVEWPERKEVPMKWVGPGLWEVSEDISFHSRGGSVVFNKVGFVIHLVYFNGEYYDNGGSSTWGSYEVELPVAEAPCIDDATNPAKFPPFQNFPVYIRDK